VKESIFSMDFLKMITYTKDGLGGLSHEPFRKRCTEQA
jgi:hypothetical protein